MLDIAQSQVEVRVSDGGDAYGATIAKRRLSRLLLELRLKSGMTANQVCDRLTWGRGKVGRFEANVWRRPEMSDIRDLLRVYNAGEEIENEVLELATLARTRAWWRDTQWKDIFQETEFPGYESDAETIRICMPLVLPGLLQTDAYIRAQMKTGTKNADWCERALASRLRRQKILDRDGTAPTLIAIITEASLSYKWGTSAERREQLEHLIEASRRPTVEIRVLPFSNGPHPGMSSMINIFTFTNDDEPSMVCLETDTSMAELDAEEAKSYLELFERIRTSAAPEADSTAFLTRLTGELE